MRTVVSYLLLLTLALSGFSGSVQQAHAANHTEDRVQQQLTSDSDMPCHSTQKTGMQKTTPDNADHNCCEQAEHICLSDCCTQHCATASALLASELFGYIRPDNTVTKLTASLPRWLFTEDPPPPINA